MGNWLKDEKNIIGIRNGIRVIGFCEQLFNLIFMNFKLNFINHTAYKVLFVSTLIFLLFLDITCTVYMKKQKNIK
jgi:hypothetical protein